MQKKYIINQSDLHRDLQNHVNYSDTELTYAKKNAEVISEIRNYIQENDKIDTTVIMNRIFPVTKPHLFISHKSEFASQAIRLANILYEKFNIISFIDSQIWHHIDDVSEMINHKVSKIRQDGNIITYNHKNTSIVASNMFAMLSSSLFETMDCSDGFIYINSYNKSSIDKIEKENAKNLKTQSPWIFLEMTYADKLRKKKHKRPKMIAEDAIIKGSMGLESHSTATEIEFEYSKDIIDSVSVYSISSILSMEKNHLHPLHNLDNIYQKLDANSLL